MKRHRCGVSLYLSQPKKRENHRTYIIISYRSITAGKKNISPEMRFNNETIRTFNQEVPPRSVNILQLIENDGDEKSPSVARLFQYQLHIFNEKT